MTINYILSQEDRLTFQLYTASRSKRIQRKRKRARYIGPGIYLLFAFVMFLSEGGIPAIPLVAIAIIWFFVHPVWLKYHYKKHYHTFIKEHFKDKESHPVSITFEDYSIYLKDDGSESKVSMTEIEEISELSTVFLIKFKMAQSLIISKTKIDDSVSLRLKLEEIAQAINVPYHNHLSWTWK